VYVSTCNNKEHFVETQPPTITDDILKNSVYEVYQADVRGIQNLAGLCSQLLSNGLTIPGNVTATGQLNIYNSNTNNLLSFNKYQNPYDINSVINHKWEVWHTSNPSVLTNNNQVETYDLVFTTQSLNTPSKEVLRLKDDSVNIPGNLTIGTTQVSTTNTLNVGGTLNVTGQSTFNTLNIKNINLGTYQLPTGYTVNVGGTMKVTGTTQTSSLNVTGTSSNTSTTATTVSVGTTNLPTNGALNVGGTMKVTGNTTIYKDILVGLGTAQVKLSDLLTNITSINTMSGNTIFSSLVTLP